MWLEGSAEGWASASQGHFLSEGQYGGLGHVEAGKPWGLGSIFFFILGHLLSHSVSRTLFVHIISNFLFWHFPLYFRSFWNYTFSLPGISHFFKELGLLFMGTSA